MFLNNIIMKGYALNERRLQALRKTVDIQTRMLADALDIEEKDVLRAVNEYTEALLCLTNTTIKHYVNQMEVRLYIALPMMNVLGWL